MELVEGQDLAEHLEAGPLAVEDVVSVAIQIAEGLEFAHDNAVMHRDLKPANIKITDQGEVKLLDFGLARAFTGEPTDESDLANSPTITAALTHAGVILGTAAYMSPEQAKGRSVDRRADIWSYGVILYELLVGRKLFDGETASETMAEVLKTEIDWGQLPSDTPATLRRLLARCLDRNPATRLRDIGEARVSLEDLRAGRSDESENRPSAPTTTTFRRERLVWIGLLLASVVGLAGLALLRPDGAETPLVQSTLAPPVDWDFAPASPYAVSPDGSQIAYVAFPRLDSGEKATGTNAIWIRDLASPEPRLLATSDRDAYPFWSPDGRWIGFFANGKLNKVESRGGPVIELCDAMEGRGGSWNQDGIIIFQRDWSEPLMRIAAGGGSPQPLTTLDPEREELLHRWPAFLPDGRHFIYYVVCTTNPAENENSGIYLGSLDSDESRMLIRGESRALYSQGHLLYRVGSTLMAHPFDLSTRELNGDPSPVATDIPGGAVSWGGAQFGVSESGLLVHMRGAGVMSTVFNWRDRDGNTTHSTTVEPDFYYKPRLSHDGTRVVLVSGQDAGDIWIKGVESGMQTRFSFDPADDRTPLWSPDDLLIAFTSSRASTGEIYVRPVSGQEPAKLIYTADTRIELTHWSSDGRHIFFDRIDPDTGDSDIWALDMRSLEAKAILDGAAWQEGASLSPGGKYLAFREGGSAVAQIYVQSFPVASGRWMVSGDKIAGQPMQSRWQVDGRALFYLRGSALMMVPTDTDDGFSAATPQFLFNLNFMSGSPAYDLAPDRQRILTQEMPVSNRDRAGARLIQNWAALLER
jgi:Tol biopolymer transport system component